jgi:ABC-2 type transport system ATP-binding protein
VLGLDAWRESLAIRKEVAYVPAESPVFDWMPVKTFIAGAARLSIRWDKEFCERLLAMWEIDEQSALGKLSSGSRSKVLLITALARRTPLVILDEPTTSLDPAATDEALAELVGIAAEGTTLLVVTHQIEVANRICDRITIMDRGRAVMDADVDELKSSWATIDFSGTALAGSIEKWEEVKKVTTYDQFTRALVRSSPAAVAERARMMGAEVIAVQPLTLREVYLAVTNRADDEKEIVDDKEDHLA